MINNIKYAFLPVVMFTMATFTSCEEDIEIGNKIDESSYLASTQLSGLLFDENTNKNSSVIELRNNEYSTNVVFRLSKLPQKGVDVQIAVEESYAAIYNTIHETDFEVFPAANVKIANNGTFVLAPDDKVTPSVKVTLTAFDGMEEDKTYIVPLTVTSSTEGVTFTETSKHMVLLVQDYRNKPNTNKGEDAVQTVLYFEVNDTNPLNNLSFTLKNSKKLLIDALIMFSGNMMYNRETGQVTMKYNGNVQALLDKYDHYLKPLQDRGMKVLMGIMPDHDGSGLCNLAPETCRDFALEIKAMCDAYNLDGIFLDEEYADYSIYDLYLTVPGFVRPAASACSRLAYEVHKLQPEKDIMIYAYSTIYSLPAIYVDGRTVQSGEYVTYAVRDYGIAGDMSYSFPGLPKSNMGLYSQEYTGKFIASKANLQWMVDGGYKTHMIFAMDPYRLNFEYQQLPSMQDIAKVFFDDELVYDGVKYPKDWE